MNPFQIILQFLFWGSAVVVAGALGLLIIGGTYLSEKNTDYSHKIEAHKEMLHEKMYSSMCPEYRDASWLKRNTELRNLSWCDKFLDRL